MVFALVFMVSCSGEDGKNGAKGVDCTVIKNEDSGIYEVFCADKEGPIGELKDNDGEAGTPGANGTNGTNGDFCIIGEGLSITCRNSGNITLGACDFVTSKTNENLSTIKCGTTPVNICKGKIFDDTKKYCKEDGTLGEAKDNKGLCNNKEYSKGTQYCGTTSNAAKVAEILSYCGADLGLQIQLNKKDSVGIYTTKEACEAVDGGVWVPAVTIAAKCLVPAFGEHFDNEYCRYAQVTEGSLNNTSSKKVTTTAFASSERCAGTPINEGKWKKEYCGWKSKDAKTQSILTDICEDYDYLAKSGGNKLVNAYGPSEIAFGFSFCKITKDSQYETIRTLTATPYGGSSAPGPDFCPDGTQLNKAPSTFKFPQQYCGYKDKKTSDAADPTKKTMLSGACDDGKGPNVDTYEGGYCQADRKGETTYTTEKCGNSKINEKQWKFQYCGVDSQNRPKAYSDMCDDNGKPSGNAVNEGYCRADKTGKTSFSTEKCGDKGTPNKDTWEGEYCGFENEDDEETSVLKGACDNGLGPKSNQGSIGYCRADKTGTTTLASAECGTGKQPNDGEWLGEYCGYAEGSTTADTAIPGICDDGNGPHAAKRDDGYCQWKTLESTGTELVSALCGGTKMNEGSWKGEYCFKDEKVGVCTGGRRPNNDGADAVNHDAPESVRCLFVNDANNCTTSALGNCDKDGCEALGSGYNWDAAGFECREITAGR